jgi:predicted enzyme related to lactoylglutathione lyase
VRILDVIGFRKGRTMQQISQRPNLFCRTIGAAAAAALAIAAPLAAQDAPPPGSFVGAVLLTDDAAAASAFYGELFGWDLKRAEDGGYAVHHHGRMIAGISPLQNAKEDIEQSFWLVGVAVDDVSRALEAAAAGGGRIYERAERVGDHGHFAVIADRQKAPLMLVEPGVKPIGGTSGHGSWVWPELWTNDIEDAAAFYTTVLGVSHDQIDRRGEPYHVFEAQGQPRAGIVTIPDEYENVEPGWAPYVAVVDLAAALDGVTRLGGEVVFNAAEHPAQGAIALVRDPSGAVLFLYQIGSHQEAAE